MGKTLKGIIPAMVTPMNQDESVDYPGIKVITEHLIENGVHGLFPAGSQGEFFSLTNDERKKVLEATIAAADGRIPVVAHVGAVTTNEAVDLTHHAESAGADAITAVTPYFTVPNQDELFDYYSEICGATSLPVLAYDNVGRTHVPLLPATVARLAGEIGNFSGIKDSSGDLTAFAETLRLSPAGFLGFIGRDSIIYAALLYGAAGAVAATANVAPNLAVGIYEHVLAGDHQTARDYQAKLSPVRLTFGMATFPVVVKEAMGILGLPGGPARRPVRPMSSEQKEKLKRVLSEAGLVS